MWVDSGERSGAEGAVWMLMLAVVEEGSAQRLVEAAVEQLARRGPDRRRCALPVLRARGCGRW